MLVKCIIEVEIEDAEALRRNVSMLPEEGEDEEERLLLCLEAALDGVEIPGCTIMSSTLRMDVAV